MEKNELTEVVFILDRSGSMSGLEEDTIGGFNTMIEKQKEVPGKVYVSTILFNTESLVVHDRLLLSDVPRMTRKDYDPLGGTALLDAVGNAIHHIRNVHKYARAEDRPGKTLFVITTDGMENSSRKYSYARLRKIIEERKKEGWEFLFLGANIDAEEVAEQVGIGAERAVDFCCDAEGTALNFETVGCVVQEVRSRIGIDPDWKRNIERDHKKRGRPSR